MPPRGTIVARKAREIFVHAAPVLGHKHRGPNFAHTFEDLPSQASTAGLRADRERRAMSLKESLAQGLRVLPGGDIGYAAS